MRKFSLVGDGSKLMPPVVQAQEKLSSEQSSITFFRTSAVGAAIQAPIAEMVGSELEFVGIAFVDTKIRQIVAPGKHVYVLSGESGEIVEATLAPGKNYYVRMEPHMGFMKARFAGVSIPPTELLTDEVQKQLEDCVHVASNSEADKWFVANKETLLKKFNSGMKKWEKENTKKNAIVLENHGVDEIY